MDATATVATAMDLKVRPTQATLTVKTRLALGGPASAHLERFFSGNTYAHGLHHKSVWRCANLRRPRCCMRFHPGSPHFWKAASASRKMPTHSIICSSVMTSGGARRIISP